MGFLKVSAHANGRCVKEGARIVCALAFVALAPLAVRAETFDLITFTPPPGTRAVQADAVSFTDATATTFAVYGVYRSAPGSGDPARDFADEWNMLVARHLRVDSELKSETVDWPGGWKMTMGAARSGATRRAASWRCCRSSPATASRRACSSTTTTICTARRSTSSSPACGSPGRRELP
jgi:hypothetical protein